METFLIVVVLLAIAVGVTLWARGRGRRALQDQEKDTAWNDQLTRGTTPPDERIDR